MSLRVLTLNCWCIGYAPAALGGSPDRAERAAAIGRFLAAGGGGGDDEEGFDVVCLQELWTAADRETVREACQERFPHYREFHRWGMMTTTATLLLLLHYKVWNKKIYNNSAIRKNLRKRKCYKSSALG